MALVVTAAAVLAAAAGAYPSVAPPLAAVAALLFLLSRAELLRDADCRGLDLSLMAAVALVGLQLVPLPAAVVETLSPSTIALQNTIALQPPGGARPLTVVAAKTRTSFLLALAALLLFLAARATLARGGIRTLTRGIAFTGALLALAALATQFAAAPGVPWDPLRTNVLTRPWGPFIDRNSLATWLVVALPVVVALWIVAATDPAFAALPARIRIVRALANNRATGLALSIGAMLLALTATLSRSGALGLIAAICCAAMLARGSTRARTITAVTAIVLLAAGALSLNSAGVAQRIEQTVAGSGPAVTPRDLG